MVHLKGARSDDESWCRRLKHRRRPHRGSDSGHRVGSRVASGHPLTVLTAPGPPTACWTGSLNRTPNTFASLSIRSDSPPTSRSVMLIARLPKKGGRPVQTLSKRSARAVTSLRSLHCWTCPVRRPAGACSWARTTPPRRAAVPARRNRRSASRSRDQRGSRAAGSPESLTPRAHGTDQRQLAAEMPAVLCGMTTVVGTGRVKDGTR